MTSIVVTGLIAWRLWKITRELEKTLGRHKGRRYLTTYPSDYVSPPPNITTRILSIYADHGLHSIESGALLAAMEIIYLSVSIFKNGGYVLITYVALQQLISRQGNFPTLIIVRIGLGTTTETCDLQARR
ncbi:hypothetical protein JAAARDRAFT_200168 [Jaapia argillacea MUCL 33604]|uniref:Uncharacterized protein n=1 Tax=Jaapia argillacea MUCL 33604 TaxID=933084 RepID=A0A067PGZ7_9AGAM|nr:hypothetical protein JAAARDRAFT_200168 [Jaapia argillacea MUCL 33604]